ncbi:MAG: UDP-glucose 4-epimerase GalE [Parachlamydiaceae bacterium]|nr:UDP-glucose 4-epimerase GalE [Parachlamydiaceae bacterium]
MKLKNILITGGAGYIGSHISEMLFKKGFNTFILDNLSRGHQNTLLNGFFIHGDVGDEALLDQIFEQHSIDAVMHFAAFIDVGESVREPYRYYLNNVTQTLTLLNCMVKHKINYLIFSSTAAIFGHPLSPLIDETHVCHPINPYGRTKLMIEKMLNDFHDAYGLKYCCLRYFNAAGGDPCGKIKYFQARPSNLIPIALRSILTKSPMTIFGTDYPTSDGTCIRDYIHIDDLGRAHILALEKLWNSGSSYNYNLGNGKGYSVKEVIQSVENVTNQKLTVIHGCRRLGDPPILMANSQLAEKELGWVPQFQLLDIMVEHAWNAMQNAAHEI